MVSSTTIFSGIVTSLILHTFLFFNKLCNSQRLTYNFSISFNACLSGISILKATFDIGLKTLSATFPIGKSFSIYHESNSGNFKRDKVSPVGAQSTTIKSKIFFSYISLIFISENNSSMPGNTTISSNKFSFSNEVSGIIFLKALNIFP